MLGLGRGLDERNHALEETRAVSHVLRRMILLISPNQKEPMYPLRLHRAKAQAQVL